MQLARAIVALALLVCFASAVRAQTFDSDGGWQQSPCLAGPKGFFYVEKAGTRWWFCTPEGNHYFANGLANMQVPGINSSVIWGPGVLAKYGNSTQVAAKDTQSKFFSTYRYNLMGEDSNAMYAPWSSTLCSGCLITAGFTSTNVSVYATVNLNSAASHPMKNYIIGVNGNFNAFTGAGCVDVFDPQYGVFAKNNLAPQSNLGNAHLLGLAVDDTDFQCGMGGSDAFDTFPPGHNKANLAMVVLQTSPVETLNPGKSYSNTVVLFADTTLYSKHLSTVPPTSLSQCWSFADHTKPPCSLPDYLSAKYGGSISALDTAWGGATYTTFGTTGTNITAFSCGTGNGSQVLFTCTLPTVSGKISPMSVAVFEGATEIGGDCPWWGNCPHLSNPALPYTCVTAGSCQAVVMGGPTSTLASGQQAFLSNNPCGNAGANPSAPHASFWAIVLWHGSGTYIASRLTGNTCAASEGDSVLAPTNPPSGVTGYDVYMACRLLESNTPAFGCVGENASQPAPTLQSANVSLASNFVVPSTGLVTGAAVPPPQSFLDYGTGAVQLTFGTAPPVGTAITINAVAGGWMWGTGLEDEDGRSAWLDTGLNPICLVNGGGVTPGTPGYACRSGNPGNNPTTFMNATAGQDLANWQSQDGAQYFSQVRAGINAGFPHLMYFGPNTLGDWNDPAHAEILQVAGVYLDVLFSSIYNTHPADETARISYEQQFFGDHPIFDEVFLQASPDSAMSSCTTCIASPGAYATQADRGAAEYNLKNECLSVIGFNGSFQCVGIDRWGSADFNAGEKNNWGLTTPSDNDYNGIEPSATAVACVVFPLLTCGSEPTPASPAVRPFGNAITGATGVIAANVLWFSGTQPQISPPAPPRLVITVSGDIR